MAKPATVAALTELGRIRLSKHFCMRDMLYSEVSNFHGIPNLPDDPDVAVEAGTQLCTRLLEPIVEAFGPITVRSAYRSPEVNGFCNKRFESFDPNYYCFPNEHNRARHIWDQRDSDGYLGATVTIVIPSYLEEWERTKDYKPLAWWLKDHLPDYDQMMFFPWQCSFNIRWYEGPSQQQIFYDYITTPEILDNLELLTERGMPNFDGDHSELYPSLKGRRLSHA